MSNEKEAPGCLGYIGDEILPRTRIPINQPRFNGKSSVFFFRSSGVIHTVDGNQKSIGLRVFSSRNGVFPRFYFPGFGFSVPVVFPVPVGVISSHHLGFVVPVMVFSVTLWVFWVATLVFVVPAGVSGSQAALQGWTGRRWLLPGCFGFPRVFLVPTQY